MLTWKTFELTNYLYNTLLRYPAPLSVDPISKTIIVEQDMKKLKPFYAGLAAFFIQVFCLLDILIEANWLRTITVDF